MDYTPNARNTLSSIHFDTPKIAPRDKIQPLNCYHTLRISSIRQGRGVWTIGRAQYDIEPGDLFILNNSETRAIHRIYPPDDLEMLVLDFEPGFIWSNLSNRFDLSFLKIFFDRKPGFSNRLPGGEAVAGKVYGLMCEIEQELWEKRPEYEQMIKVKLLNILVLLNRHYQSALSESNGVRYISGQSYEIIRTALDHIDRHFTEELSLGELSAMLHLDPAYLSRLFKKYNGIGISQYVIRKRVQQAVFLLQADDRPVTEIAYLCGFNNTANFYKAFKSVTRSTPSAYRQG